MAKNPESANEGLGSSGKSLAGVLEKLKSLVEGLDEGIKKIVIYAVLGISIIIGILIILSLFSAQPAGSELVGSEVKSAVADTGPEISSFALPDLPGRINQGDWSPAYPPKPRWTVEDLALYLPPLREVLLLNLREKNHADFEALLEALD